MARSPQNWEQAIFASDKRYLLLSFVHTQPLPGTFIPSPPSLHDAGRLIRCSRQLAGAFLADPNYHYAHGRPSRYGGDGLGAG